VRVRASDSCFAAIDAVAELLSKLRLQHAFVGSVARSAWLGSRVEEGSIDVLALLSPEQKDQVAMMANNRGFRVDRGEIEQSEELDLIPMKFGDVRVHVLVASNALYGRMVAAGVGAAAGEREIRVAAAEDLALLSMVAEDAAAADALLALPGFDRAALNRKLAAIGLGGMVVRE
jgi:hypothetical protein